MADTTTANPAQGRAAVDQTPDPDEIDRAPATERGSKMPSMPGTTMDPKKMIGFAAAAGAIMFTVLALGTGLTGNAELPPVKPKPALEPAQYDPNTVIAPTLAASFWRAKRSPASRRMSVCQGAVAKGNAERITERQPPAPMPRSGLVPPPGALVGMALTCPVLCSR